MKDRSGIRQEMFLLYGSVSHKDRQLPNSRIWFAKMDIVTAFGLY